MTNSAEINRLLWHSRRGALELDILLSNYVLNRYSILPDNMQQLYKLLLEEDDPDLMSWLIKKIAPPIKMQPIVDDILSYSQVCRKC